MKKYLNIFKSLVFSAFALSSFLSVGMEPGKDDIVLKGVMNFSKEPITLLFDSPQLRVDLEPGESESLNYTLSKNSKGEYPEYFFSRGLRYGILSLYPSEKYKEFVIVISGTPDNEKYIQEFPANLSTADYKTRANF